MLTLSSSGDSGGISVAAQKTRYTQLANRRPSTVLTLNHETHGTVQFMLLFLYFLIAIHHSFHGVMLFPPLFSVSRAESFLASYDVLPHAINQLRAKGYKFVTVAQCLGRAPYQSVGAPAARTVSQI